MPEPVSVAQIIERFGTGNFEHELDRLLIGHEGFRVKPYTCPAGKLTIGVGRNLADNGISGPEAMLMLHNDLWETRLSLEKIVPRFLGLSPVRRAALIDMCFNLGLSRFMGFKQMLAALKAGDFDQAADAMLDSTWATQVGERAKTLADMMRHG